MYDTTEVYFKDLIMDNIEDIKSYMTWENYDLNDTVIPVVETLKDHALIVLMNSYGTFHVEQGILEPFMSDIFIHFPILMQQLSITRLIDAYGVVKDDIDTVETVRTESNNVNTEQDSTLTVGTSMSDNTINNAQQKTTGTVGNSGIVTNNQDGSTTITNNSGIESTGNRNVSLSHQMPEQSLNGSTGNLPVDNQGTPILTTSYIQDAQESFNSSNPVVTNETSEQSNELVTSTTNDNTTTNDITIDDEGLSNRTVSNSGSDNSESKTNVTGSTTFNETVTSKMTNKQYAYEIKAFLETADGLIAFKKWDDKFSWVVGII